ncbi:MAG: hypothetical protein K6E95_00030 [Lachnospiraceae bacterium]|nr:hypothetical protein [Lachnospiraceae bacterium]
MPYEKKRILKQYLLLCEGKDAENFLIKYLESEALRFDPRFGNEIQVMDFGGNEELVNYLMNLKNMSGFDKVVSLAVVRDAEKDFLQACKSVVHSLEKSGFLAPKHSGEWIEDEAGMKVGFVLFPLKENTPGTLEDLCLQILSEKNGDDILATIDGFLNTMQSAYGRTYPRLHKNRLNTYLASNDNFVTMPLGLASKAGAFDWGSKELEPLKEFLGSGFVKQNV